MTERAPHQSAAPLAATNPPRAVASATPAPHERPPSAVEVHALTKTYPGGVEAVRGIDFDVEVGEVFGLLGPNGAGKSTTIGMLTTTIRPSSGTARLAGHDVASAPLIARSLSSVVFQEAVVDVGLSGRANLQLHARLWGVGVAVGERRIADLSDGLGLGELLDRPVATYSGGQRRRLEIARALISRPRVLFLDEPTVGLDPLIRHELLDVIADVRRREEMTILLTTHYLEEAERLCDRVAIMHEGEIVALDTPARLLAGLGSEIVEFRVDGDAPAALMRLRSLGLANDDAFAIGARLTIPLRERAAADTIAAIAAADIAPSNLATRTPSLDDVYLRLTGTRIAA